MANCATTAPAGRNGAAPAWLSIRRLLAALSVLLAATLAAAPAAAADCPISYSATTSQGSGTLSTLRVVGSTEQLIFTSSSSTTPGSLPYACNVGRAVIFEMTKANGDQFRTGGSTWTMQFADGATLRRSGTDFFFRAPMGFSGTYTARGPVTVTSDPASAFVYTGTAFDPGDYRTGSTMAITQGGNTQPNVAQFQFIVQVLVIAPPTITSVSPSAGPATGTNSVTIGGSGFSASGNAVTFGGTSAAVTAQSTTAITVTAPAHAAGAVDVAVTTAAGDGSQTATATNGYVYVAAPTVTSVAPTAGRTAGGTSVVLDGTNFTGTTAVFFDAAPAASFVFNSNTRITATSPAAAAGTVNIRVTTAGGTSATSSFNQFTYVAAPAVTSLSPTAGPAAGGTTVILTGTNISGATAVTFGATAATAFTVNSATQITAVAPAGTGTVDVRVTTSGGTSAISANDHFTYVTAPTVTGLSPTAGPAAGGTTVTITGTGFSGATAVTFGATPAGAYTVNSATQITATSPAGTGTVDVRVTTSGGTSAISANDQFTYVAAPTVTSLAPISGPATGGTTVTITGTGFSGATAVTFGATAASGFTVNSAISITAVAPAGTGTVDVRVTTVGGTSATGANDRFTYVAAPAVTSLSPTVGATAGGTSVVVTGTGFSGATAVTFGATGATSFTVDSATQITAISPAGSGSVDVRVTTTGGTSATGAGDQFTYVAAPTANAQSVTVPYQTATAITLTGSDPNSPARTLTYTVTTAPTQGTLSGTAPNLTYTPTSGYSGADSFKFTVDNGAGTSAPATVSITVAPAIAIAPTTLPDGTEGVAYSQTLTTSGGTAPYTYAVSAGALPDGLTLSSDGVLAGTPGEQGSYGFTVTSTDSAATPATATQDYTVMIAAPAGGLTRTWVSGVGDDGNACTRTAPCQTFAAAILRTATGGEINCLDAAGYGTLTITKSVSIICGDKAGRAGVIASGESGIVIDAPASASIVLNGLDFEGVGNSSAAAGIHGVRFVAGGSLIIRNSVFRGFRGGYAIDFEPGNAAQLLLDRVSVADSGGTGADTGGILIRPSGSGNAARVTMARTAAIRNMQSGIRLETVSGSGNQIYATLDRLTLSANTSAGLIARGVGGAIQTTLVGSTSEGNGFGVITNGATSVTWLSDTTVARNGTGLLAVAGGSVRSLGGNSVAGNTTDGTFTATTPRQ